MSEGGSCGDISSRTEIKKRGDIARHESINTKTKNILFATKAMITLVQIVHHMSRKTF